MVQVGVVALAVGQKGEVLATEMAVEVVAVIEDIADVVIEGRTSPGKVMPEMFSCIPMCNPTRWEVTRCKSRNRVVIAIHPMARAEAALKLVPMETNKTTNRKRKELREDRHKRTR